MMYRQSDLRWKNEIMTGASDFPSMINAEKKLRWPNKADTLKMCGCLVTACVNAHNYYFSDFSYTPGVVNKLLRMYHGYNILNNNGCKIGEESFLEWGTLKTLLKIKNVDYYWKGDVDIKSEKYFYICRVPYSPPSIMSGHYCFIVDYKKTPIYHDSDTGAYRKDWGKYPKYFIHRLEF